MSESAHDGQDAQLNVRAAEASDVEQLTAIWFDGWHDAHDRIVTELLVRLRTRESFRERLSSGLTTVRVITELGTPVGFAMIRGAELYQFFIAASARGTGVAATLMRDVEAQMAASGVTTTWLGCAVGNTRAARFYEKSGWWRVASVTMATDTSEGPIPVQVWKYEKNLR